jgi:hypothetical protein
MAAEAVGCRCGPGRFCSANRRLTRRPAVAATSATARGPPKAPCSETRKTGRQPGLSKHRRRQRRTRSLPGNVPGRRTDSNTAMRICAHKPRLRLIANTRASGAGDGSWPPTQIQASDHPPERWRGAPFCPLLFMAMGWVPTSYRAIAAALALREVSTGERLVAFSLASYANSDQQAWPSDEVAAARAGLARSRYLAARRALTERGLIRIEHAGRGRASPRSCRCCSPDTAPVTTGRSTPNCSKWCSPTVAPGAQSDCCSRLWPRSQTRSAWSTTSAPRSCVQPWA